MVAQLVRTPPSVHLLLAGGLVGLGVLVVTGACTGIDQYAIDHWMARVGTGPAHGGLSALQPWPNGGSASDLLFNIWTFPGSVPFSAVALGLCCVVLERRGDRRAAGAWIAGWLVVNAIEVAGKGLLHRPALSTPVNGVPVHVVAFDTSFPSGHTARALLLAFVLVAVWPRLAWPAGLWAAGACVFLVVGGDHTPSDVAGGALVALLVAASVRSFGRNDGRALEIDAGSRALSRMALEDE